MAAQRKKDEGEKRETDGTPEVSDNPKAHGKSEHPLFKFFGPECESEIADDNTLTRGAETFCAAPEGAELPDGTWQDMAERDGIILHRRPL